jgi:hypothetical protein
MTDNPTGSGGIVATAITAQALGGALAVVWMAFHKVVPANGIDETTLTAAVTVIFSTICSVLASFCHVLIQAFMRKYLSNQGVSP